MRCDMGVRRYGEAWGCFASVLNLGFVLFIFLLFWTF